MYLIFKNTYLCLSCICVSRDAFWHLVHIHAEMPVHLNASAWKVVQLTWVFFSINFPSANWFQVHLEPPDPSKSSQFILRSLLSVSPVLRLLIATKPMQFFTHLTIWAVVLTLVWKIFYTEQSSQPYLCCCCLVLVNFYLSCEKKEENFNEIIDSLAPLRVFKSGIWFKHLNILQTRKLSFCLSVSVYVHT